MKVESHGRRSRRTAAWVAAGSVLALSAAAAAPVDFERDIRPILAEKCLLCHGPDDEKGGLRLTGIDFALRALDSGATAIVPGDPEASELVGRIRSPDPDEVMPPPAKAGPLTETEKDLLERWIAEGAEWPVHWAYAPLARPEPPSVARTGWLRSPIDAFVLAALEARGIAPSPEADDTTLIRRLHLDLIGLPPPPSEVDRFRTLLAEDREAGLVRLVDDLLASPHFGERWGRHWLDKARYADSDGYEKDNHRPDAWRFRDWVIEAINADVPFDRFTIEQFAGDLLDDPAPDQLLATAFNRQTLTNTEGGTDREQWRVAAVMDRVETMGSVWMGLTLTCARCHTHKFDEITQAEYYRLFAYFDNADEANAPVPRSTGAWSEHEQAVDAHRKALAALDARLAEARTAVTDELPVWEERLRAWLDEGHAASGAEPGFVPVEVASVAGPEGVAFEVDESGIVAVGGANPDTATYTVAGRLPAGRVTAVRLEALPHDSLGGGGPGRSERGNFVLSDVRFSIAGYPYNPLVVADATAAFSQDGWDVRGAIDGRVGPGKEGTGWAISPRMGRPHEAVFGLGQPVAIEEPADFTLELVQAHGSRHTLGRFRITVLTTPTSLTVPRALHAILAMPATERTGDERAALAAHVERIDAGTAGLAAQRRALAAEAPAAPLMEARILRERTSDRRTTRVLRRGEFKQPLDPVEPGTPAVLPPVAHRGGSGDRLDLARWLVDGENPLPPRVAVNQIWAQLLGEGIVTTLNDFGVRGDRPSHPGLLDWLASEFIRLGWSRKQLIRTIVLSGTYRQSSAHRPELLDIDPKNRLLARQNRFRIEAEIVRDLSLAAAGLLSPKVGGPSVFPPIPPGVADVNYNSAFQWKTSDGEDRFRRGLYTYFKRTAPHPNLMTFDCPDSNVTCVQRTRSNTPLAALITLNNETFVECARGFAERVAGEVVGTAGESPASADAARLDRAFRVAVARAPEREERESLAGLLEEARAWFRAHPEEAASLAGASPREEGGMPAAEAAAWIATLRVVLNLDEFLTRN